MQEQNWLAFAALVIGHLPAQHFHFLLRQSGLAHEVNPPANDIFGTPLTRNDSSGDFFEMTEAQGLDRFRQHRRDGLVGLVGTKRRADDGAGSPAAFGLTPDPAHARNDLSRTRLDFN